MIVRLFACMPVCASVHQCAMCLRVGLVLEGALRRHPPRSRITYRWADDETPVPRPHACARVARARPRSRVVLSERGSTS